MPAQPTEEQPTLSRVRAIGAFTGVALAVALVGVLLFGSSGGYRVKATFINAGQLVEGNLVQVAGVKAGTVDEIAITPAGQAEITLDIDQRYAPLPVGTRAVIRQASQSGIANRYIELRLPETRAGRDQGAIGDGGRIAADQTETAVDLDQLLNTLDPETRRSLQDFLKGSARQYAGRGEQAGRAFEYLNPALAQTSRVFNELNRDAPTLERLLLDSARLVTALAARRNDLTDLVSNLNRTTRALGDQKGALGSAIGRLPGFMRRSNTTFVNLRSTLDELDPLVAASKPVARRLRPFLEELRPFARDARPTISRLDAIVRQRGPANDLIELFRTFRPLAQIAVDRRERSLDFGTGERSVGETEGAFPATAEALTGSAPIIAQGRPYTVDLLGWFDDFSTTGPFDAVGGMARIQNLFNAFSLQSGVPTPLALSERPENFRALAKLGQYRRCPGGAEAPAPDGSNVLSADEQQALDCSEEHRATSPR